MVRPMMRSRIQLSSAPLMEITSPSSSSSPSTLNTRLRERQSIEYWFSLVFGTENYTKHSLFQAAGTRHETICQTTWGKGDIAFRCLDCESDHNCVICTECYFDSEDKHASHRVRLIRTQGGCCDCGDTSSWKPSGFCSKHGETAVGVVSDLDLLTKADQDVLNQTSGIIFPAIVEIATESITSEISAPLAEICFEFFTQCCRISPSVLRPNLLNLLTADVLSVFIQVCCVLSGRNPRPRPPVVVIPSRAECASIPRMIEKFTLVLIQMDAKFKVTYSHVYLSHYAEIVRYRGDISTGDEEEREGDLGSLSVQLFTIPEVCESLLTPSLSHQGLIPVVLTTLSNLFSQIKDPMTGKLAVLRDIRPELDITIWRNIHDLGYILNQEIVCDWLLTSDESGRRLLVESMLPLHRVNVQQIKHGDHVLYENVMWRSMFRLEQLLNDSTAPFAEFCRNQQLSRLSPFLKICFELIGPFNPLQLAGEKGTLHIPIVRFLAKCVSVSHLLDIHQDLTSSFTFITIENLRSLLMEAIRPYLMAEEIVANVWVRNGQTMRYQVQEYMENFHKTDLVAITVTLIMMKKLFQKEPILELVRAFQTLIADIPDDTTGPSTMATLSGRIASYQNPDANLDDMDEWTQSFLRDVIIGGEGGKMDESRRSATLFVMVQIICTIMSDFAVIEIVQLGVRNIDIDNRKILISKCISQKLVGQKMPLSSLVNLLPPSLRQPEDLVQEVVSSICAREPATSAATSGGVVYRLNPSGVNRFDYMHLTFGMQTSDQHLVDEFVTKNNFQLFSDPTEIERKRIDKLVNIFLDKSNWFMRFISSILRVRLMDKYEPNLGFEVALPITALDPIIGCCLKILDSVCRSRNGVKSLTNASECFNGYIRPPFAIQMRLEGLIQRPEMNSTVGLYFGRQEGRHCVAVKTEGKLLAKSTNTLWLLPYDRTSPFCVSLVHMLEELASLSSPTMIGDMYAKAAKQVAERLRTCTDLDHLPSSTGATPNTSVVIPSSSSVVDKRQEMAKKRQEMLLEKMRAKQAKFQSTIPVDTTTSKESIGDASCAMCRISNEEQLVAISYCAPSNSVSRTSGIGANTLAVPVAPYISSCLHVVHASCWQEHVQASSRRSIRGDFFLVRDDAGEVQCPVCRSLSNCAIPILRDENNENVREAILDMGQRILDLTRANLGNDDMNDLWLNRTHKPWRPMIVNPPIDAIMEATLNELVLSVSLAPHRINSGSDSLLSYLVRCLKRHERSRETSDWFVWDKDPRFAWTTDCARLLLESGVYDDVEFACKIFALRYVQLTSRESSSSTVVSVEMARLALLVSWIMITANHDSFSETDINRIAYLPENADEQMMVIESVLGLSGWRQEIRHIETVLSREVVDVVMNPARGGLVDFIDLPEKFVDLVHQTLKMKCKRCNTRPADPAICLLCGEMVCLDADCCRGGDQEDLGEGECTQHAKSCGAGQGVFILPFASIVLAVAAPRNCVWDGPYEDENGETDSYLKRSIRLKLSKHRLERMRLSYTRGTIAVDIVRQNDATGRYVPRRL